MKTMILFMLISGLGLVMLCCNTIASDETLSLQKTDYEGSELRMDGYYYHQEETEKYAHTSILFLYKNGIALMGRSYTSIDLNIVEKEMIARYETLKNEKDGWGVFLVVDNQIIIEQWNASTGGSLPTVKSSGYIDNDSTFVIKESYFSDIKKTYHDEFIYRFKQFDNKPDSTNVYIK